MALTLIGTAIVVWILYLSVKFYRRTNWDEPAESSPDFAEMHKKEAQLLHIQDVLQEAHEQGKLSASFMQEFKRFADHELQALKIDSSSKN